MTSRAVEYVAGKNGELRRQGRSPRWTAQGKFYWAGEWAGWPSSDREQTAPVEFEASVLPNGADAVSRLTTIALR